MSIYSIPTLLGSLLAFAMGLFVLFKNRKSGVNISFFLFSLSVFVWLISYTISYSTENINLAINVCKLACTAVIFIAPTFYHFTIRYLKIKDRFKTVWIVYMVMFVFLPFFIFTDRFLDKPYKYFWGFYSKAGPLHPIYLIIHFGIITVAFILLLNRYIKGQYLSPVEKNQLKYVFVGYMIAAFGQADFLQKYGFEFYPFGFVFILAFVSITAYAILRYRLMEIEVIIRRAVVFAGLFGFVFFIFGSSIALAQTYLGNALGSQFWAMLASVLVITIFYDTLKNLLIRLTDKFLFQKKYDYQKVLKDASKGMTNVTDLKKLLGLIVHIVTGKIRIRNAAIYLLDKESGQYTLKARRFWLNKDQNYLDAENILIKLLGKTHSPVLYDEIRILIQRQENFYEGYSLLEVEKEMRNLSASLIVPSFTEDLLLGFLVLGDKLSGEIYTQEDLNLLQVLSNQAAIAIENAMFYEESGKSLAQQFHEQRLRSLGKMGSDVGHQMGNRFQAVLVPAQLALMELKERDVSGLSREELLQLLLEQKQVLEEAVKQAQAGGEICRALTQYSRAAVNPRPVLLAEAIKSSLSLLACKFPLEELNLKEEYDKNGPYVWANLSTLQEIFVNILDNAHYAMLLKSEKISNGQINYSGRYQPQVIIRSFLYNEDLKIEITDNGIGMTKEQLHQLFVPFFTTKATSEKGTGIGMSVIKKLLELNRGEISVESEYLNWTKVSISLPLAREEQIRLFQAERTGGLTNG